MMNNKGQTLVMFVIILPILLIVLTLVVDLGLLYIEKRNISNNTIDALEYYLDNLNDIDVETKTINLLNKNIEDIEINIDNKIDYVEISVKKEHKGIYSIISNNQEINVTYIGNKNNKEIIKG